MKVQNITNIDKFFEVVDSCTGKVELVTGEGDRLNLKSKLSQYVLWQTFSLRRDSGTGNHCIRKRRQSINWLTS